MNLLERFLVWYTDILFSKDRVKAALVILLLGIPFVAGCTIWALNNPPRD